MNERIKELIEQAGLSILLGNNWLYGEQLEEFAELIRLDETKACAKHYLEIMRDAVEQAVLKEREACAKLCDEHERPNLYGVKECTEAIRQRGEQP